MENSKQAAKVQSMVAEYKTLRAAQWNHAAAAHKLVSGVRGPNKFAIVKAFLANEFVAAAGKKFEATIQL